ncbi:four helix bundle protein [Granulicella tundricola]|uniref:S23 ribosomal protein n=1 Tax=Granulicella tundricola (strain ATCC BAA-1859 / DSM 23138 / MP5ACTX9) TaxID=1198114 RepID=E8WXE2_GRATM|nr:four helix bundle protein [Granulicella tundricola]ADW67475.1 hypothetical protein AciX9_0403 [Granulicella tundricola MP5ACTX9]
MRSHRQLTVWQRAIELAFAIYDLTKHFPPDEHFGLTSQLRRAAVSIPSNIAEGQSRDTRGEFRHFLGISRGSLAELQTQLVLAKGLHLGDPTAIDNCESLATEVTLMLIALQNSLPKQ